MSAIREAVREKDPAWADRILRTEFRARADIPAHPAITAVYERLKRRVRAGPQYEWLARLAQAEGLDDLELCIESRPEGICALLAANTQVVAAPHGPTVRLKESPADPDLELFRRFSFPVLDQTKLDMERGAREAGFSELMERTWFCFRPRNGQPCGRCHPCQVAIKEGMERRLPPSSRFLGRLRLLRRAIAKPLRGR